jgi:cytochrome c oxidase accessory protein FixG
MNARKGDIADFIFHPEEDTEEFRDSISTVDSKGKRLWVYPKRPEGFFTKWRQYVSYVLLAVLFALPFIKVDGEPLFLLNVLERRFILFGQLFMPQDFHLFVFAMLTLIVFIILFTVVFGRIFCGWICPQTIFMEGVFRRIEYWIEGDANAQRRLNNSAWTGEKIRKKTVKHFLFYGIAILIANTFLAYIIGADEVLRIVREPVGQHLGGFIAMLIFSAVFYFVFSYMREQVCIVVCPYGRLQGVLQDRDTIVVAYDQVRGEPRTKLKKARAGEDMDLAKLAGTGDCIDCKLCVQVCPTGIDIRNGTQLECINCTACIDACDAVMDKIDRPRGLIRYDSFNGIAEGKKRRFTPRMAAYTGVLLALIGLEVFLLNYRVNVEALILRTPGKLYQEVDENRLSNLYNYELVNKTNKSYGQVEFRLMDVKGEIQLIGQAPVLDKGAQASGSFFIILDKSEVKGHKNPVLVEVIIDGERMDMVKTNFLGPIQ